MSHFAFEFEFQQTLSIAQAYPILGPIFVSPVKAICALIQTVVSLTCVIFLGLLAILFEGVGPYAGLAGAYFATGLVGIIYSAINILSLGYIGYKIEKSYTPTLTAPSLYG